MSRRKAATPAEPDSPNTLPVSRRLALAAGGVVGTAFLGAVGTKLFEVFSDRASSPDAPKVIVGARLPAAPPSLSPTDDPQSSVKTSAPTPSPENTQSGSLKAGPGGAATFDWVTPRDINADDLTDLNEMVRRYETSKSTSEAEFLDSLSRWFYAHGGADGGVTKLRVHVSAGERPITIETLDAVIEQRLDPLRGGAYFTWPPEGGEVPVPAEINLDNDFPSAKYFKDHVYHLDARESATFDVTARTRLSYIQWRLRVQLVEADGSRSAITAQRPFRTTARFLPRWTDRGAILAPNSYKSMYQLGDYGLISSWKKVSI